MEPHVEYYLSSFAIPDKEGNHKSLLALYYKRLKEKQAAMLSDHLLCKHNWG